MQSRIFERELKEKVVCRVPIDIVYQQKKIAERLGISYPQLILRIMMFLDYRDIDNCHYNMMSQDIDRYSESESEDMWEKQLEEIKEIVKNENKKRNK